MSSTVYDALSLIADFDDDLNEKSRSPDERKNLFIQHLKRMDKLNFKVPNFKQGLDWLNTSEPLSWENHLQEQIVILDFFTYCCINCMHILPDLKDLEDENPIGSGVIVVGVHSAKFANEKVTANILSAVLRYGIRHPVVNDSEATLWQELSVSCWPTLLFIGPSQQLLYTLVGEGHSREMLEFVNIAKEYYHSSGKLISKSLPIQLEENKVQKSVLNFPGKVFYWKDRDWLVISDTGNHRIVVTDRNGVVQEVIGNGMSDFMDGSFLECKFSSPQGVACWKDKIYVADTGNHAIRVIDLNSRTPQTFTGNGKQGSDKEGGKKGTHQELASPWDIILGHSKDKPDSSDPDLLYIAMAGSHQIWVYFLDDAPWYKGRSYDKRTCIRFAGSGAEENRNNAYPEKAGFAQPSGLTFSKSKNMLYIADSESSSIRSVSLMDGKVSAVVGAEKDPLNLFASGDTDGRGVDAKLQHPLGIALLSTDGPLIVADSYNNKLKKVDLSTFMCESLSFTDHADNKLMSKLPSPNQFNEPGGLSIDESSGTIYVADTNNCAIKRVQYQPQTVSMIPIILPREEDEKDSKIIIKASNNYEQLPDMTISSSDKSLTLSILLGLNEGEHLNLEAPNRYTLSVFDESQVKENPISEFDRKGSFKCLEQGLNIPLREGLEPGTFKLQITLQVFVCLDKGDVCLPPRTKTLMVNVHVE